MATIPIDFANLLSNHPHHNEIRSRLEPPHKKQVEDANLSPYAIQVSYALNKSGAAIEANTFHSSEMGRAVRLFPPENQSHGVNE